MTTGFSRESQPASLDPTSDESGSARRRRRASYLLAGTVVTRKSVDRGALPHETALVFALRHDRRQETCWRCGSAGRDMGSEAAVT